MGSWIKCAVEEGPSTEKKLSNEMIVMMEELASLVDKKLFE